MKTTLYLFVFAFALFSCNTNENTESEKEQNESKKVEIKEVIQTETYTYVKVKENDAEKWFASTKMEIDQNKPYYYKGSMIMRNFKSKTLNRTFDSIYFIERFYDNPDEIAENTTNPHEQVKNNLTGDSKNKNGSELDIPKQEIKLLKTKNDISIADIYSKRKEVADKFVTLKGVVAKFNADIMRRNWVHLQDGTEDNGHYDLVVTTKQFAKVGDTLTMKGKIVLDKDFGYGYKYEVIMEHAEIIKP